jgi:PAS domain S-box-containing protein
MKPNSEDTKDAAKMVETLRLELERCQYALDKSRGHVERLEGLFTHMADAIFVTELDGQIIDVNPAACAMLGYEATELLGRHPWNFVTSASREEILGLIQKMEIGTPVAVQRIYRCKTGEQKLLDLRLTRFSHSERELIIASCRDITEQKRLEDRLRLSEQNLAEGQRLTKTGSWILDYHTGNTDWSIETCRIFGFPDPPPSPHYSEFRARVRPEDREGVDRGLRESFETGEPRPLKYLFVLPDGVTKNIETISQPVKDETGKIVRLMGTVMDVTERTQAAEALRASEHLARGQLAALARTLDSLAQEFDPDKLPKHVVTTILTQMGAHSVTIWERNGDVLDLLGIVAEGRFKTSIEAGYFGGSVPIIENVPPLWGDALQAGMHFVIEDISIDPARVILADGRTAIWSTAELPTPFADLKKHFIAGGVRALLISPMMMAGQLAGIIGIRFTGTRVFGQEEIELTKALAHQAMLAMKLMRLSEQSREAAVMAERNRMARDIHDTLAQGFTGVIMQLEAAKGATTQGDLAEAANRIERASDLARSSLGEARRSVRALRPRSLRAGKLFLALDDLLKRMAEGINLNAEFQAEGDERSIPSDYEEGLLRITQEALTNAVKHANARYFKATLSIGADKIQLRLVDDGRGFDPQKEHDGFGLIGMKERVDRMGGEFIIRTKQNVGTEILVELKHQSALKPENGNE